MQKCILQPRFISSLPISLWKLAWYQASVPGSRDSAVNCWLWPSKLERVRQKARVGVTSEQFYVLIIYLCQYIILSVPAGFQIEYDMWM